MEYWWAFFLAGAAVMLIFILVAVYTGVKIFKNAFVPAFSQAFARTFDDAVRKRLSGE